MDKNRFEEILAAYGADPRRWPEAERAEALTFAETEPADPSEARTIDALLDLAPRPVAPNDMLMARIMRERPRRPVRAGWALAACMLAGVLIGFSAGMSAPTGDDVDAMIAAAFESGGFGDAL